MMFDTSFL